MLTADTRNFFGRAREEDFVRAGAVLSMEGSSTAGCPPRSHSANTVYEITMSSNERGLPLRWGLAFASLGELVRTSSTDMVPRGAHGGDFSFSAGDSPRNMPHKTYRANKANKAQSYKSHASYRTNEAKTAKIVHTADDFCLSWSHHLAFRAGQIGNAHHQSSNIK